MGLDGSLMAQHLMSSSSVAVGQSGSEWGFRGSVSWICA